MIDLKSRKGKWETKFSWKGDELKLLIQSAIESKCKCEFEGKICKSKRSNCEEINNILIK